MVVLWLFACGLETPLNDAGPVEPGIPTVQPGWTSTDLGAANAPVVVALGGGEQMAAWVVDGVVRTVDARGETETLPSAEASSVALAADGTGRVHAVFEDAGSIRYTLHSAGAWSTPVAVSSLPGSAEPTLAVAPDGDVVVAWVRGTDAAPVIEFARGADGVFGTPAPVNAGCCIDDFGEAAYAMTGPSLAIGPDGRAHIVYEWMSYGFAVVEYVGELEAGQGVFQEEPESIALAAFMPCPSVVADEEGAHVTWLPEYPTEVHYTLVADGLAAEPETLYAPDTTLVMAMSVHDGDGSRHLVVTEWTDLGTQVIRYLPPGDLQGEVLAEGIDITLTPRAGGFSIGPDGEVSIAWERTVQSGSPPRAEFVIGR